MELQLAQNEQTTEEHSGVGVWCGVVCLVFRRRMALVDHHSLAVW